MSEQLTASSPTPSIPVPSGIRPLRDRLLVRRIDLPDRIGLIYVPDQAKKPMQAGVVVVVGDGLDENGRPSFIRHDVKVGDLVVYTGPWQGEDVEWNGERLRILDPDQVAAVVEGVDPAEVYIRVIHHA